MPDSTPEKPERYIGLDIHKHYVVACGVDAEQEVVLAHRKIIWAEFEEWVAKTLTRRDAVVLEMTTNTWEVHDALYGKVQSITVVHPPHVALIVRARVMTDRIAAQTLAKLLAAGLLVGIWVPTQEVRDLRALVAQRWKMTRLGATAKTRLHNVLHRHHLEPPKEKRTVFHPAHESFWLNLPVSASEGMIARIDWATLQFAESQRQVIDEALATWAARDERVPLLVQLPGFGMQVAVTVLAAIEDIERFPSAKKLVGYAGLGAKVHDSGQTHKTGGITKSGRKDLRAALVHAAGHAVRSHPHWKAWYQARLPRMGRMPALVAVARKLLVVVWHVLTKGEADRFASDRMVACSLFAHAYRVRVHNLPEGQSALAYTRYYLDQLKLGRDLSHIPWGSKTYRLPPSRQPT